MLDIGKTKFWQLVKDGRIETVTVGNRRMVVFKSLKRLVQPQEQRAA